MLPANLRWKFYFQLGSTEWDATATMTAALAVLALLAFRRRA